MQAYVTWQLKPCHNSIIKDLNLIYSRIKKNMPYNHCHNSNDKVSKTIKMS